MGFAENLNAAMQASGITEDDLASRMEAQGVSVFPGAIRNWLSGATKPDQKTLLVASRAMLGFPKASTRSGRL